MNARSSLLLPLLATLLCAGGMHARGAVVLGIDNLVLHHAGHLRGKHVAVVTNHTGITHEGRRSIDAIRGLDGVTLEKIFTPEHGLTGAVTAGGTVPSSTDNATHVQVVSLYGAVRKPTREMLRGLDAVIFDIQDIGIRSYTFISTLGLVMEACGEAGVEMIVCDRPGLLANRVDGNVLDTAFRSFVGKYPIPYVYGLTIGELAMMINEEKMIARHCNLTVIPLLGWSRSMPWDSTGLVWIPTSPNIPQPSTAIYCAAFGAIGELGVGYQGIGSRDAFRVFGGATFARRSFDSAFAARHFAGVRTSSGDTVIITKQGARMPISFIRFHIESNTPTDLFGLGLSVLSILNELQLMKPSDSAHIAMFTKVSGMKLYEAIRSGIRPDDIMQRWGAAREVYMNIRAKYLRYS